MRSLYCSAVLYFLGCSILWSQSVTIGVKTGGRVTDDLSGIATSESKRYVVGPAVELSLPHQLSLEFDALYRRQGYRTGTDFGNGVTIIFERERANSWEFPVLVERHWIESGNHCFAGAGLSVQRLDGASDIVETATDLNTGRKAFYSFQGPPTWAVSPGWVIAAGFRIGKGRLQLSPEFRYTHWIPVAIEVAAGHGYHFESTQNQIDLVLGLSWKVR